MMLERVYLETSIVSYLAAHPSRDLITAARQQITHEWWTRRRPDFDVFISEIVVAEAAAGNADAARRRAQWMKGVPSLRITEEAAALARLLVHAARLPDRAAVDALHISLAACHGMHYLLTWNSAHIANAEFRPKVERACRDNGHEPPVLCTPDELMGV
jgi:predicted nucleic acid-binding protein